MDDSRNYAVCWRCRPIRRLNGVVSFIRQQSQFQPGPEIVPHLEGSGSSTIALPEIETAAGAIVA